MEKIISDTDRLSDVEVGDDVEKAVETITPEAVVVCGTCGAEMKNMGPLNRSTKTVSYEGASRKFSVGTWVFSCRYCGEGSVRALLNPMLDTDNIEAILPAREQLVDDMMDDRVKFSTQSGTGHVIVRGDELVEVDVNDGKTEKFHESRKNLDAADE